MTLPKFTRTAQAAEKDRTSKWDLIEAIAADATDAGVPIVGLESRTAALEACAAAGTDYTSSTVKNLCIVAKFDSESTPEQRQVWRRYGWSVLRETANAGWTPDAAHELLSGERLTRQQVRAVLGTPGCLEADAIAPSFDERVSAWVVRFQAVMHEGAQLVAEGDRDVVVPGGHAALMFAIFAKLREDQIDVELRHMLETTA